MPWRNKSAVEILHAVSRGDRPPLAGVNPQLARIIERSWDSNPSQRPTAEQLQVELKLLLEQLRGRGGGGGAGSNI